MADAQQDLFLPHYMKTSNSREELEKSADPVNDIELPDEDDYEARALPSWAL